MFPSRISNCHQCPLSRFRPGHWRTMNAQGTLPELYRIMEGLEYLLQQEPDQAPRGLECYSCYGLWIFMDSHWFSLAATCNNLQQMAHGASRYITVHHGASRCITVPHVLQPDPVCIILKWRVFLLHQPLAPVVQPWPQQGIGKQKPWQVDNVKPCQAMSSARPFRLRRLTLCLWHCVRRISLPLHSRCVLCARQSVGTKKTFQKDAVCRCCRWHVKSCEIMLTGWKKWDAVMML